MIWFIAYYCPNLVIIYGFGQFTSTANNFCRKRKMEKIIRGYWDCSYCDKKKIDGLIDICPSCGKRKSESVKYYMENPNDIVSESELNAAGISKEECDGKHKEWICPYCLQLNNWADQECKACGSGKNLSEKQYGDNRNNPLKNNIVKYNEENKNSKIYQKVLLLLGCILPVIILIIGFFPYKEITTISGFSWERCVYVEEYKTFSESGWTLPDQARLNYSKPELYGYEKVLDHYETKTRQVPKQVLDGYETYTSYSDNGNGTFSEHTYQTPIYRTEYYDETYQEAVYRDEPVYKTKYYYDIDRWTVIYKYPSKEEDKTPYWNTDYILKDKQRDTKRTETYNIIYVSKKKKYEYSVDYETWEKSNIGDSVLITKCLFGIVYNRTDLTAE